MTHIHIYFKDHQKEEALTLKAKLAQKFPSLVLGRFHEKPVGPHPVGSFLVFPKNEFMKILPSSRIIQKRYFVELSNCQVVRDLPRDFSR